MCRFFYLIDDEVDEVLIESIDADLRSVHVLLVYSLLARGLVPCLHKSEGVARLLILRVVFLIQMIFIFILHIINLRINYKPKNLSVLLI